MTTNPKRGLYRSSDDRVLFGVCGGIAEYFDVSAWGVRLIWVLLGILGLPFTLVGYFVLALLLKPAPLHGRQWVVDDFAPGYPPATHSDALASLRGRFESLDQRIQRMEAVVTSSSFALEQSYRDLR